MAGLIQIDSRSGLIILFRPFFLTSPFWSLQCRRGCVGLMSQVVVALPAFLVGDCRFFVAGQRDIGGSLEELFPELWTGALIRLIASPLDWCGRH